MPKWFQYSELKEEDLLFPLISARQWCNFINITKIHWVTNSFFISCNTHHRRRRENNWCIKIKWNLLCLKWVHFIFHFDVNSKTRHQCYTVSLRKINCWGAILTCQQALWMCVFCVCVCVLFDENRQTELTNCPREQIFRVGVWIQIIVLPGSKLAVFMRDWSHGEKGSRFVWAHSFHPAGQNNILKTDYEQQWQKPKSAPGRHQKPGVRLSWQFRVNAAALQHLQVHLCCSDNTGTSGGRDYSNTDAWIKY